MEESIYKTKNVVVALPTGYGTSGLADSGMKVTKSYFVGLIRDPTARHAHGGHPGTWPLAQSRTTVSLVAQLDVFCDTVTRGGVKAHRTNEFLGADRVRPFHHKFGESLKNVILNRRNGLINRGRSVISLQSERSKITDGTLLVNMAAFVYKKTT